MVARARWRLCELHFLFFSIFPLIATNCFEAISSIFKVDYCMEKIERNMLHTIHSYAHQSFPRELNDFNSITLLAYIAINSIHLSLHIHLFFSDVPVRFGACKRLIDPIEVKSETLPLHKLAALSMIRSLPSKSLKLRSINCSR